MIIYKGLYDLKESGARWHEVLSDKLRALGFVLSKADSNLWMKDMGTHYEYIATYVDDLLVWSKHPHQIFESLKKDFELRGEGPPTYFLGGDVTSLDGKWKRENINLCLSSNTYIRNLIPKFEKFMT